MTFKSLKVSEEKTIVYKLDKKSVTLLRNTKDDLTFININAFKKYIENHYGLKI